MKLSKNLTLAEATKSNTAIKLGIDNTPPKAHVENLKAIAENIFQPIRDHFKKPIAVTSGYRSAELNKAIGGAGSYDAGVYVPKSQHCYGEALDIDGDAFGGVRNSDIFEFVRSNLDFDQMIWEFGDDKEPAWVHVSFKANGKNRKQLLRAVREGRSTRYLPMT